MEGDSKARASTASSPELPSSPATMRTPTPATAGHVRKGAASSLPSAHSHSQRQRLSAQPRGPAPETPVSDGCTFAPEGPALASGQFIKGAGEGGGRGGGGQLCLGSEWVTARSGLGWPPAGEVGKL